MSDQSFAVDASAFDDLNTATVHFKNTNSTYTITQMYLSEVFKEPASACKQDYLYESKQEAGGTFYRIYESELCSGVEVEWISGPQVALYFYQDNERIDIRF